MLIIFLSYNFEGKKDFKDEIGVMALALTKEMEMLENQLNKSKAAAAERSSLRDEADSLKAKLSTKVVHQVVCFIQILVTFQCFKDCLLF